MLIIIERILVVLVCTWPVLYNCLRNFRTKILPFVPKNWGDSWQSKDSTFILMGIATCFGLKMKQFYFLIIILKTISISSFLHIFPQKTPCTPRNLFATNNFFEVAHGSAMQQMSQEIDMVAIISHLQKCLNTSSILFNWKLGMSPS